MAKMKQLFLGIAFIVLIGFGGFFYRNALQYNPPHQVACPMDARVCPDGTAVGRVAPACAFQACPPPNVLNEDLGIAFALPAGFAEGEKVDPTVALAYDLEGAAFPGSIVVRRFPISASSTALAVIQETAIGGTSGLPIDPTRFTSTTLGQQRFTVVVIDRFEANVQVAYYLARTTDVLRFDAIDRDVVDWMEPSLDMEALPVQAALRRMLTTLQGL